MDITTANRLYELRKQHGYSQDELADKLNVSRQAISKWERSESSPDTDNLIALAKLYGVSLDELLNYTPAKPGEESKESQAQTQDENTDENAQSAVDDDKNDTSSFDYEENGDRVHIDENGIHVHDKDGSNVIIKGGIAKLVNKIVGDIHVENGKTTVNGKVVDNDDDDKHTESSTVRIENGHVVFENKKEKRNAVVGSIVNGVTFFTLHRCISSHRLPLHSVASGLVAIFCTVHCRRDIRHDCQAQSVLIPCRVYRHGSISASRLRLGIVASLLGNFCDYPRILRSCRANQSRIEKEKLR